MTLLWNSSPMQANSIHTSLQQMDSTLSRTALFETHRNLGARLVPFAGWEMPVQYEGVRGESLAVRQNCGIFDVSHMGQLDVRGPNVSAELNKIVSADWSNVPLGRVAYSLLLNENGGVQDDIMGYHLAENHWLVVVNASRATVDEAHLRRYLPAEIELSNRYENQAMIAIQGPNSQAVLQTICDDDLSQISWRDVREVSIWGQTALLARGGYTGSDGFEWMGEADQSAKIWAALLEAGAVSCGLGARDVLRLEAALPLYGHELREDWIPDVSRCAFVAKTEKAEFVGRDALIEARANRTTSSPKICGLKMLGKGLAREDYPVQLNGEEIGFITSGSLSPILETGVALALLPADLPLGTSVDVMVRGKAHPAEIVKTPFVAHERK